MYTVYTAQSMAGRITANDKQAKYLETHQVSDQLVFRLQFTHTTLPIHRLNRHTNILH